MENLITKYRPTSFDEVIGQDKVIASIKDVLSKGLSRSFILSGQTGGGKTTTARIIAQEVGAEGEGIIEVDAATHTGIDAMRDIMDNLQYHALGGKKNKVVILDEAHRLSSQSWASLLKSVEEPPKHAYWIFCTTNPEKIPPAIKNRCVSYEFKAVDEDLLFEFLKFIVEQEGFNTPDEVLDGVVKSAEGSPRKALSMLGTVHQFKTYAEANIFLKSAANSSNVIDLCRFLVNPQGRTWSKGITLLKNLEEDNPESIRLQIVGYLTKCLLGAKSEGDATRFLILLDKFSQSYNPSEKMAPLILSVGSVILGE